MNDNLKALLSALGEDEDLQKAYHDATEGKENEDYIDAIVAFAKEHGYKLGIGDFGTADGDKLQEDELSTIAGGLEFNCSQNYLGPRSSAFLGNVPSGREKPHYDRG